MTVDDYVEQFHFGLMEVVFEWARGMVILLNIEIFIF
jgi:superfamily II RNA helicase